ncbi:cytochrome P450 3A2-like [Argiope bruennichi]|uniref:cytochrome P450 3A2-like n=1 Tax=Argiope bruennichi TaxID=94029 RepID=UPI00249408E2|nr:cytochrome P450 3A2-like [Argiope bruennichi]
MEFIAIFLVTISVCIATVIISWTRSRQKRHRLFKECGIPGPEPAFWNGNLKEIKSRPTPHETIAAWLKNYGNVFGFFMGELPFVVVKDLEMLKQVDITVDVITKEAQKNEAFDMHKVVQGLTLDVIADCALAMKTRCQDNPEDIFLTSARSYFHHAHGSLTDCAIMFPSVARIMSFFHRFTTAGQMTDLIVSSLSKAIAERSKNPKIKNMDFLQLMLDHRENSVTAVGLSDEEIVANAYIFILGGYESTSTALAFTFHLLVKHPEIQEKHYEEIQKAEDDSYHSIQSLQFLNQVLTESLRLYPPVTGFITRECSEDYQVGSVTKPKGVIVEAPVWDIHHDPDLWPDPWKFDPDRFSPENKASLNTMAYMAFGIGRRNCIAANFVLAEIKLAIFKLLKKFRFEACEKTADPLPLACPAVITFPADGVYLKAIPRAITI